MPAVRNEIDCHLKVAGQQGLSPLDVHAGSSSLEARSILADRQRTMSHGGLQGQWL